MIVPSFGVRHRVRGKVRWRMSDREAPDIRHNKLRRFSEPSRPHPVVGGARIAELGYVGNRLAKRMIWLAHGENSADPCFQGQINSSTWFYYRILTDLPRD
jgi:hypothetical protein